MKIPTLISSSTLSTVLLCLTWLITAQTAAQSDPLNILVIGAHPDDADLCAGGSAIHWSSLGHRVKFVSLTNGDAGHQSQGGGALAKRRRAEAQEVARRLGIAEYEVLDNHDGELLPSLDVRLQVIRQIRTWKADVVILPRPSDYHPDHRNTGLVVQDAAYMVIVPNVASDTPPLEKNPVFLYCQDRFEKPKPFEPDISIDISAAYTQKIYGLDGHVSQFYEWLPWTSQALDQVPAGERERREWLAETWSRPITPVVRDNLSSWYGTKEASAIKHAEAFEICEYGSQPGAEEILRLFPMLQRPKNINVRKTDQKIKIDGKLDERIYGELEKHELWNSLSGRSVNDPDYKTYFYLHHDDRMLYIAFLCNDRDIYSTFKNRDDHLWEQEVVEVFIDTDRDPKTYFELEVSPTNILFDSYIVDPEQIDLVETPKFNFKNIKHAVSVDGTLKDRTDQDRSWSVEIAIPLEELKEVNQSPKENASTWRINFYRINTDSSDIKYMAWRPTFGRFHKPQHFGTLRLN